MDRRRFVKRHPLLLELEGWYGQSSPYYPPFKFSCRYNDILRCTEFRGKEQHFWSCYNPRGLHPEQPRKRCENSNWAIIYTPDKHGNFMGRCFVELRWFLWAIPYLTLYHVYGNRLSLSNVERYLRRKYPLVLLWRGPIDKTL